MIKRPIIKFDSEGKYLKRYKSLTDAAADNPNTNAGNISRCCKGDFKQTGGYKYIYASIEIK